MPSISLDTQLAAYSRTQKRKRNVCAWLMDYFERCGTRGATADQAVVDLNSNHNHIAPRVTELVETGELVFSGDRRPTRTGCLARVFVAKQFPHQRRADPPATAEDYRLFPDDAPRRHLDLG